MLHDFKHVVQNSLRFIKQNREIQETLKTVFPILTEIVKTGTCESTSEVDLKWIESAAEKVLGKQKGFDAVCKAIKKYDFKMQDALLAKIASNILQLKFSMKVSHANMLVEIYYFISK